MNDQYIQRYIDHLRTVHEAREALRDAQELIEELNKVECMQVVEAIENKYKIKFTLTE